jgi:hypothetical protein
MKNKLSWQMVERDDETLVVFSGNLDEKCDLTPLADLSGRVSFDLEGIFRINSVGVTRWVQFVNNLEAVSELVFEKCSLSVVTQLNMVQDFRGKSRIGSFYAPYICRKSGEEQVVLLRPEELGESFTPPTVSGEKGDLELDDLPERYFTFLMI